MTVYTLPDGEPILLKPVPARKFKDTKLPGSELLQSGRKGYVINLFRYHRPGYDIIYRSFHFQQPFTINTNEQSTWLRLETVLTGELPIRRTDGSAFQLLPGHYHLTDQAAFQSGFKKDTGCSYFSIHLSPEMISSFEINKPIETITPRPLPKLMQELIYQLIDNPFSDELLPFYYNSSIRQLFFLHTIAPPFAWPGELTPQQVAAMYEADRIMAENFEKPLTIHELARRVGTSAFFLKRAYEQVFGIGIYPRYLQRRMERAKYLMEYTDSPLKDICDMAGYETLAGFITEFRKRFGPTPNEWRKMRRGL